jgi:hypothetical protein
MDIAPTCAFEEKMENFMSLSTTMIFMWNFCLFVMVSFENTPSSQLIAKFLVYKKIIKKIKK